MELKKKKIRFWSGFIALACTLLLGTDVDGFVRTVKINCYVLAG